MAQRCTGVTIPSSLFSAVLNYRRNSSDLIGSKSAHRSIKVIDWLGVRTNYPLTLSVDDLPDGFRLTMQADPRIDPRRVLDYLLTAMDSLLVALRADPDRSVESLTVLPAAERDLLLRQFNQTATRESTTASVHELCEKQALRNPDRIAIVCGSFRFSYSELNDGADRVAYALRRIGVRRGDRVGLYMNRGAQVVAGMLGILKAGAAYVPMDVAYPMPRIEHILEDSLPTAVLTEKELLSRLPPTCGYVITLSAELDKYSESTPKESYGASDHFDGANLAYIIYTSGSTGKPKGVMVEHRSLVNLVQWHCRAFGLKAGDRCSGVAAIGFDAATWEIWPPLAAGATLVLAPADVARDAQQLTSWWLNEALDVSFLPTPLAESTFVGNVEKAGLRTLLVGGDQLRLLPENCQFDVVNNYGPTECTVVATSSIVTSDLPVIHIGKPIDNCRVYILDGRSEPAPLGVTGEICIAGAGVARGYLNQPELTASRILPDPFSLEGYARMYRTGDLGRWREDGTIEYLGRNDAQVKIRGYRIELGEIESNLRGHALVKEALVEVREDVPGEKYLAAYFTRREDGEALSANELSMYLQARLPGYMIPAAFMQLGSLPLTANGKLDRRALPMPDSSQRSGSGGEPLGEVEQALAGMWKELLHVSSICRDDSFFDLGGHSLIAIRLALEIGKKFAVDLNVSDIYRAPTLSKLAERIEGKSLADEPIDLQKEAFLDEDIRATDVTSKALSRDVLLTGATGFVGRFLVARLLRDRDQKLYCLVRAASKQDAMTRLRSTLSRWMLWRADWEGRIDVVVGDLGKARLGLDATAYDNLSKHIDCIYHCATSMNHLQTYAVAKRTNVESIAEILRFAIHGRFKQLNYISSLSVFQPAKVDHIKVVSEQTSIDEETHTSARGYVASKWVAEKMIQQAMQRGIPCNIFRVGLAWADTELGRYDELQQGYRLLKSCLMSGSAIRNYSYPMAPTPVDFIANAVVSLAKRYPKGRGVFHIASPEPRLGGVFETVNEVAETSMDLMSHFDWICRMRRLHESGWSLPAVALIQYAFSLNEQQFLDHQKFSAMSSLRIDCEQTYRELELAGVPVAVVNRDLMRLHVQYMLSADREVRERFETFEVEVPCVGRADDETGRRQHGI